MPILAVTHALDGRLTASSLLVAWLLTAVFTALLIWRIRILMRGDTRLGRAEGASYGALMATILAGSVLVSIAANPSTYDEEFGWSVALVVGALFTLLGMLQCSTAKGAVASGLLILAANLNRSPTGYACGIAWSRADNSLEDFFPLFMRHLEVRTYRVHRLNSPPQHVRPDRAHGSHEGASPSEWLLPLPIEDLQALQAPQALDALLVDSPAFTAKLVVGTLPAPTRVVLRELHQPRTQLGLCLVRRGWLEALGGADLADCGAGSPLGYRELLCEPDNGSTAGARGQNFPSEITFRLSMSRAWLATIFFSLALSLSSSCRRLASPAFIPPF